MKIFFSFTFFILFLKNIICADPLTHADNTRRIIDDKPANEYVFEFDGNEYVLSKYNYKVKTPYSVFDYDYSNYKQKSAFTIKKMDEEPFLILVDLNLNWTTSTLFFTPTYPKCLSVDVYYSQNEFSALDLLKLIRTALEKMKPDLSYDMIHLSQEPCDFEMISQGIIPRVDSILLDNQTFAEKMGCDKLYFFTGSERFGNTITRHYCMYQGTKNHDIFKRCEKWLSRYVTIDDFIMTLAILPDSKEKDNFLSFLEDCKIKTESKGSVLVSDVYKKIAKFETEEDHAFFKLFHHYFFKNQELIFVELVKAIYKDGFDQTNPLHQVVASKILSDTRFICKLLKESDYNLTADSFLEILKDIELKTVYENYNEKSLKYSKIFQSFPLEKELFAKLSDEEIKKIISGYDFFIFPYFDKTEFSQLLDASLSCLEVKSLGTFKQQLLYDALNTLLDSDFSWSYYLRENIWNSIFGSCKELNAEIFIKWYFCCYYVSSYEDFFISASSSLW